MLITLETAKNYLHVDTADEDATIALFLASAERLCADIARLSDEEWSTSNSDTETVGARSPEETPHIRELLRIAILYTVGYLYEHREEADHHDLTLTLRAILSSIREGVV